MRARRKIKKKLRRDTESSLELITHINTLTLWTLLLMASYSTLLYLALTTFIPALVRGVLFVVALRRVRRFFFPHPSPFGRALFSRTWCAVAGRRVKLFLLRFFWRVFSSLRPLLAQRLFPMIVRMYINIDEPWRFVIKGFPTIRHYALSGH